MTDPDPERARRVGLNEALFREINDRLEELAHRSSVQDGTLDLVCECGDRDCGERISLTLAEYQELRSDPLHFAVLPDTRSRRLRMSLTSAATGSSCGSTKARLPRSPARWPSRSTLLESFLRRVRLAAR